MSPEKSLMWLGRTFMKCGEVWVWNSFGFIEGREGGGKWFDAPKKEVKTSKKYRKGLNKTSKKYRKGLHERIKKRISSLRGV